jgi:hypothetical protein
VTTKLFEIHPRLVTGPATGAPELLFKTHQSDPKAGAS